jgi:hypothetical protein
VSLLLTAEDLQRRRRDVAGPLRPLADSLASDLDAVLARDLFMPADKARLTRRGGRCEVDGVLLEFDPVAPRSHRCPECGRVFDDEAHYRWWVMGYQLWLAERAVHAAALFALRGDERHARFARAVLDGYADHYLSYPNRDNVLGPTRPFFSTYLESIWLLQIVVALDLLESSVPNGDMRALGSRVRDRLIEPSASLIASYDEGLSNRQVWNNAALLAASRTLGHPPSDHTLHGPSGLTAHLTSGLLGDGTWYEGENYHLFAHRGLWYGVVVAGAAGSSLDPTLLARFDEAFATPFVTALPDFTFPSRRDSQYRVSLRQWRFAEMAELGLVRQPDDDRLRGALAIMYDGSVPRGDTGRARSTAEAERNGPPSSLGRDDLGWRSLLFALPSLPALAAAAPRSALMREQGLAILRRDAGTQYAALDYGHSGAGHGHPDRLNFILVRGDVRWLDDVGTGSYVDPSLHWYRSTLAHNAPLVDGRSQRRVHGALAAYEDRGGAGWVRAFADGIAPGIHVERTIVVMPTYLIDEVAWRADREVTLDLPFHVDGELVGAGPWVPAVPSGAADAEDGFRFLTGTETASGDDDVTLEARRGAHAAQARIFADVPHAWWRATAFGPPREAPRRFHFVRATGRRGTIATVWDLTGSVTAAKRADRVVTVTLADGESHEHRADVAGWHIALRAGDARSTIDLDGSVMVATPTAPADAGRPGRAFVIPRVSGECGAASGHAWTAGRLVFELGEPHYRRSEPTWVEAGAPAASVALGADSDALIVGVDVRKPDICFAPACDWNVLDNEHPDTNSDGVQLHVIVPAVAGGRGLSHEYGWLLVPESGSSRVRVTLRAGDATAPGIRASWSRTETGYRVECRLPLVLFAETGAQPFLLDVIVNDMSPERERRRGQLVLGGAAGEFVYLRGDRHVADRHLAFVIAHD